MIKDRERHLLIAANNLVQFNELAKVLRLFSEADVPVIVLKGAALANTVYGSIGDRPMSDVDLLIHREDQQRILSILNLAGYQIEPHPPEKFHPFNPNLTGEINIRSNGGVLFDLHWELTSNEWVRQLIRLDTDALWCSAQPLEINGAMALQLSPADTLLHVCLHLMYTAYSHRVAYQDIAALIDTYQPFPWDEFLERVGKAHLRTSCYIALDAASGESAVDIPAYALDRLRTAGWKKWLIHQLSDPIKGMQGETFSRNKAYLVKLLSADELRDVVRVLFFLFVPGPAWLAERYHLDRGIQAWFACIWHPFNILSRGILGVWEVFDLFIRRFANRKYGKRIGPGS